MAATRSLTPRQHDELLRIDRKNPDPELRSRAHLILRLAEGHPGATIEDVLFCSRRTIDRGLKRFEPQGAEGLAGRKRGCPFRFGAAWLAVVVTWVTRQTPRDFGFLRSRWACATVALLLAREVRPDCQPGDGATLAASRRPGLPPPPTRARPHRPRASGQARQAADAAGRAARRRDGPLAG